MRKGSYLAVDYDGVKVEGGCLIVDRNTLYVRMMGPYEVYQVLTIDSDKEALTETEEGENALFAYGRIVMREMYRTIKLIEREREMFQRLHVNFNDMKTAQHIRFYKRVFHSETDRHYFLKDMEERIDESYLKLFDKYIISADKEILALRQTLMPQFLSQVLSVLSATGLS